MAHKTNNISWILEANFAIEKFNVLPPERKMGIYAGFRESGERHIAAGIAVLKPLTVPGINKELAAYAIKCLGAELGGCCVFPSNQRGKAIMLFLYFQEHLRLVEGVPTIDLMSIDAVYALV